MDKACFPQEKGEKIREEIVPADGDHYFPLRKAHYLIPVNVFQLPLPLRYLESLLQAERPAVGSLPYLKPQNQGNYLIIKSLLRIQKKLLL